MTSRSTFIRALAAGLLAAPLATLAQQPAKLRRIGVLANEDNPPWEGFRRGLRDLGYVDGGNVTIEWRYSDARIERFPVLALELVQSKVDVIVASRALFLHMRLLAQVVGEFYESKRREAAMRKNAYLQAVHETGARLTHDVKNLLQSLYALTSASPREGAMDDAYANLLQRQLPQLTKRLQSTLEQLRSPQVETRDSMRPAKAWWKDVERRHVADRMLLEARIDGDVAVPANLFDAFIDNCLNNARGKGTTAARVKASFAVSGGRAEHVFENDGDPVPAAVEKNLFREPIAVSGKAGLGIGLYQVARLAAQSGYSIELAHNEPGRVVFRLFPA